MHPGLKEIEEEEMEIIRGKRGKKGRNKPTGGIEVK
jgi:hypothetical protein